MSKGITPNGRSQLVPGCFHYRMEKQFLEAEASLASPHPEGDVDTSGEQFFACVY